KADAQARKTGHVDLSAYRSVLEDGGRSEFTGYHEVSREARIRALLSGQGTALVEAGEGDVCEGGVAPTPVYPAGRGQQAGEGTIRTSDGELKIFDVQQPVPGLTVHKAMVVRGGVRVGAEAFAEIDIDRRRAISRSHTATHLVHQTMREFLGEAATQAGSL